jgi:hypothetical protein
MSRLTLVFIIAGLLSLANSANAQFSVSAELRPRFEMDNGTVKPRPDSISPFYFATNRTRIRLDFEKEKYQMRFTLQDVRVWGNGDIYSSTGVFGSTTSLDVYEAWFRLKLGEKSNLTFGRQELKYDDQRLISWRDWNQYGLAYDAIVFNFNNNGWDLNAGVSYNNMIHLQTGKPIEDDELFNQANLIKTLNFINLRKKFSDHVSASASIVGAGYTNESQPGTIYMMATYGLWGGFNFGGFDATINAYFQNGHAQSGKNVSAYMLTLDPGYKIGKFRLGAGLDYISGDDANSSNYGEKERTFNKMYGAVFKYFGWMNYYTYMKSSTKNGGLMDIYPNVKFSVNKKHSIDAFYHFFSLANSVKLATEIVDDKNLGSELDLRYTYKIMPEINMQAGFSYYFVTESLEKIKGVGVGNSSPPYWAWVMITFKPTLFVSK